MLFRRAIAVPVWLVLRLINIFLFAAGIAALVTAATAWFVNQTADYE